MRPRAAVVALLAGLLTGGFIVSGATPTHARPQSIERAGTTLSARLAPPVVTEGEPAALVAQLAPSQSGRALTVEVKDGDAWTVVDSATSNATGRAVVALDTSVAGARLLRVVAEAAGNQPRTVSAGVTLTVHTPEHCTPKVPLVDRDATASARCLAARLDGWKSAGLMGVGQQLNMSSYRYAAPLAALGTRRVSVVGFDLWELAKTKTYEFPFFDQAFGDLVTMAQNGAVLTASWHAPNPHTGQEYNDRSWHDLGALLQSSSPEAQAFWAEYDEQLSVLAALQDQGVAVVFRPFHEANGDWFWWGRPNAKTYKSVWRAMQDRAWAAGVHNVLWAYSFAATTRSGISAPEKLLPSRRVDVAGIDSYYPSTGSHRGKAPSMSGYAAIAKLVPRMAFSEIGPAADTARTWKPSVITSTARAQARKPVWALLWVDDAAGYKQISSLTGGLSWLDSCPNALCKLG